MKGIPLNALPLVDPQSSPVQKPASRGGSDPAQVKKAAREFEAMFVGMMLKSMRETVGKDKLTGGGHGEETFRSLLDQEYANQAARNGSLGLAQSIERELTRGAKGVPAPLKGPNDAD